MVGARFRVNHGFFLVLILYIFTPCRSTTEPCAKCPSALQNGRCVYDKDTTCKVVCNHGFWGKMCEYGRIKLTKRKGYITHGHKNYNNLSKIMWLVEAENRQNSSIHFEIDRLSTECNWDYLYIFDGGSIYSPQIAAFSGAFETKELNSSHSVIPQDLVAKSGVAYLYFYSDVSVAGPGFNISYSIVENCACSARGRCNTLGVCLCDSGWSGDLCNQKVVDCSKCQNGVCNVTTGVCLCNASFTGEYCEQEMTLSYWTSVDNAQAAGDQLISPRASHGSVIIGNWMYVYSGYTSQRSPAMNEDQLFRYHLHEARWGPPSKLRVPERWGHTLVAYQDQLIVFGGENDNRLVDKFNTLVIFTVNSTQPTYPLIKHPSLKLVAVTGHTATVVGDKMYVIFGMSAHGLYQHVQVYDIAETKWEIIESDASFLSPRHEHSSIYDEMSGLIYVYGGLNLIGENTDVKLSPTDSLIAFAPDTKKWSSFARSGFKTFLHSAVILDGMMLVYGGNSYIDSKQKDLKCHSSKLLAFDFACQQWKSFELPQLPQRLARYGHTAVVQESTMYIFGGFNGALFNDVLTYTHGKCDLITNETECLGKYFSAGCFWTNNSCTNRGKLAYVPTCPVNHTVPCSHYKTCPKCSSSNLPCRWSSDVCQAGSNGTCPDVPLDKCRHNMNCVSCSAAGCFWSADAQTCMKKTVTTTRDCPKSCTERLELSTCLGSGGCIWCENLQRCVNNKLYVASFPYGQCFEWATKSSSLLTCTTKKTCQDCYTLPGCGWCEGEEMTGIGQCRKGGASGPTEHFSCQKWRFDDCPACQCNGHSRCEPNSTICVSCTDNTIGKNCETCDRGYFGEAKNGGVCDRCQCNGHGDNCDAHSGQCECTMKGAEGNHCERCAQASYVGNATNGGYCFYKLSPDFIYRINVTDRRNFNFVSSPEKTDRDTEVMVDIINKNKTFHAKLNISVGTDVADERFVVINKELSTKYRDTFSKDNYDFGKDNFYFKIYIHDATPFTSVSISIHQPTESSIDLLQFFIIFLACFIGLLILAVIFWKAKATYDALRVSRRRNVELVYMTNRPFASIPICIEKPEHLPMKSKPSPLTSEICYGNKAAVYTVLVQMPVCAQAQSSSTANSLCLGSTLVSYSEQAGSKMMNYVKNVKRRRNPFRATSSTTTTM